MLKETNVEKVIKHRFPEPVALVICRDKFGKVNMCPVGFFCMVSWEPKIWGISLYEKHYSTKVISETKEFVLCLPSIEQVEDIIYCGSVHGWDTDKTKNTKFKFQNSKFINTPVIDNSIACFECKVVKEVKIGDHFFFIGEVLVAYESNKGWEEKLYNWDDTKLGTLELGDQSAKICYSPEGE